MRDSSDLTWRVVGSRKTSHVGALPNGASASDAPQVPQFLVDQVKRLVRVHAVATVSHCLVNHYERGRHLAPPPAWPDRAARAGAGIHEHLDGPLYEPRVAVLSLGGDCVMEFLSRDKQRVVASLALRANSLLVFSGTFYTDLPHRIVARDADLIAAHCLNRAAADVAVGDTLTRGDTRISLTFRKAHNKRCWLDTAQHQSDALLFTESARDEARRREAAFVQMISEK